MELDKNEKHIKMLLEKSVDLADELDRTLCRLKNNYSISRNLIDDELFEIDRTITRSIKDLDALIDKKLNYKVY
jgi:hypothetical protein